MPHLTRQMEYHPEFVVDPVGQLHQLIVTANINPIEPSIFEYKLVENAPIIDCVSIPGQEGSQSPWLAIQGCALTVYNDLYLLRKNELVTFPNHPTSKFKRIINQCIGGLNMLPNEPIGPHRNIGILLIDTDDNLWQCGWINQLVITDHIKDNVTHCSIVGQCVIGYCLSEGWFSWGVVDVIPIMTKPDSEILPPIDEVIKMIGSYILTHRGVYEALYDKTVEVKINVEIVDLLVNWNRDDDIEYLLAMDVDGRLYEPDPYPNNWKAIRNPLLRLMNNRSPWIRLVPLIEGRMGVVNRDGEVYSIRDGALTQLEIPVELMRDRRSAKNSRFII